MMNTNDPIYVTKPFLPPLEEFSEHIENIWETKQPTVLLRPENSHPTDVK
jgi:hypothetical protein